MCGHRKTIPPITTAGQAPPVMGTNPQQWELWSPRAIVEAAFDAVQRGVPARVHFEDHTGGDGQLDASPPVASSQEDDSLPSSSLPTVVLLHGVRARVEEEGEQRVEGGRARKLEGGKEEGRRRRRRRRRKFNQKSGPRCTMSTPP